MAHFQTSLCSNYLSGSYCILVPSLLEFFSTTPPTRYKSPYYLALCRPTIKTPPGLEASKLRWLKHRSERITRLDTAASMADSLRSRQATGKRKRCGEDESKEDVKPIILSDSDDDAGDSDGSDSESTDDEDTDRNEGINGPCEHNEDDEPFPDCVAFDKDFVQVGEDLTSIAKSAMEIIDENGCESSRAQGCRKNADELTQIPRAKREKVAFLGSTGVGKSSLLNCLLGIPDLAKAMSGGQSCTYVGTEYECPFPGQTKKFAAKVEYFDISEISKLLEKLLQDFFLWTFQRPDDLDPNEEQELQRLSSTAFNTLMPLFCNRVEFHNKDAAVAWLQSHYWTSDKDALPVLVAWCEELLAEKEADEADHVGYIDAESKDDLLRQINPLISSSFRLDEPALWPLVRKIRIGIDGPRVLQYITLVDLPGLDDVNKVRVDASYDMMRSCDSIWIVTKIARAITDTAVDALLMRFGKTYKVAVICTGIDDGVDPALANHLHSEGQSVGNHQDLLDRERKLRNLVKRLPKKIETRSAKLDGRTQARKKAKRPLTEKAKRKLSEEIAEYTKQLEVAGNELPQVAAERFELLVDARNANTIRQMQQHKVEHLIAGTKLQVFAVSNLHYEAIKGARVINGPRLSVKDTGIPALRQYALESAAPYRLQAMEDFISHKFTIFLQGLGMWAKSFSIERSEELLQSIRAPVKSVHPIVEEYLSAVSKANDEVIVQPLHHNQESLISTALTELEKKRAWNWQTIRAFMRRNGNFKTSVVPQQSWNESYQSGATKMVHSLWDSFVKDQSKLSDEMKCKLLGLVLSISETLDNHPAKLILPMDRIQEILDAQSGGIKQACRDYGRNQAKELRNIKLDLTQDRHTGYFTQAMEEAYETCKQDTGTGVKSRSMATFETHLNLSGTRSPFHVMTNKLNAAIVKDTKAKTKVLARRVEDILEQISDQFPDLVDEKIEDKAEEDLRKVFRAFLEMAEPRFEDIKADLARIKRRQRRHG
ncbi:Hypothetical predicted protein [Lecanosticta acicola]|uniref:DUF7605 domain-containing protein n=1 Tax=Lecanosticta acicola TaxID=111012 RepID=A0AAI8YXA3_9PEZI|nr:Hypothetical predicted protein [Lecanosticta acicola]